MPLDMNPGILFVGMLVMLSIILVFFGLARNRGWRAFEVDDRLDHYAARGAMPESGQASGGQSQRRLGRLTQELDRELSRQKRGVDISQELAMADVKLTPAEFLILTLTCVLVAFGLGLLIFRVIWVAIPFSILGYVTPRWYLKIRQMRRQAAFSAQLPNAVTLLATSLRSGYSLLQSMDLLSKEMQPPVSEEFGRVVREVGLGVAIDQALNNMLRRIHNDDLTLLITVMLINHDLGGNLAQILDLISYTIRERVRIKGEIRTLTAQQQASGYFVGSLPFLLTVFLFLVNPAYMGNTFNTICGVAIFIAAFSLVGFAMLLVRRIVNIEV